MRSRSDETSLWAYNPDNRDDIGDDVSQTPDTRGILTSL